MLTSFCTETGVSCNEMLPRWAKETERLPSAAPPRRRITAEMPPMQFGRDQGQRGQQNGHMEGQDIKYDQHRSAPGTRESASTIVASQRRGLDINQIRWKLRSQEATSHITMKAWILGVSRFKLLRQVFISHTILHFSFLSTVLIYLFI